MVPPGLVPDAPPDDASAGSPPASAQPAYVAYVPYEPPADLADPMPPPGGWTAPDPAYQTLPSPPLPHSPLPPPPLPPGGYAPPPPGWYPGAPQPPTRKRRGWVIALCIAIPVVVIGVIAFGIGFARGTDPEAAKDRDAAERALLVNGDLGGTFQEVAHRTFARSRGGMRVDDMVAECGTADDALEKSGRAVVDTILQSRTATSLQLVTQEIMVVEAPEDATPVVDAIAGTARVCAQAAMKKSAGTQAISLDLSPASAPDVGDRAAAFSGSAGANGAAVAMDILIAQQGRAIVLIMTVDTTGSFHDKRLESAMRTTLSRLAPTFGN